MKSNSMYLQIYENFSSSALRTAAHFKAFSGRSFDESKSIDCMSFLKYLFIDNLQKNIT